MIENKYTKIINGKTNITRKNKILDTYLDNIVKRQMGTLDIEDTGIYQTDNQFYLNNIFFKLDNPIPNIEKIGKNYLNNTAESTNINGLEITNNGDNSLSIEGNAEGHYKTVQGTSFTITDADTTKQASITEIKGNTTQSGTPTPSSPVEVKTVSGDNNIVVSNKNLLPLAEGTTTMNGLTVTIANGEITLNGTTSASCTFKLTNTIDSVSGTIIPANWRNEKVINSINDTELSINYISGTAPSSSCALRFYSVQSTSHFNQYYPSTSQQKHYYDNNVNKDISFITFFANGNLTFTNYKFNIQLEKGTVATSYIAHQGNSYRVDLGGKNLYYIAPETKNGVTLSYDSDGAMVLNGKSTASFTAFTRVVKYSGTYTLSTSNTQTQGNTFVRTRNSSNTIIHSLLLNQSSRTETKTNNDIAIFEITIGAENVEYNNFKIYVQLEKRKYSNRIFTIYCNPYRTM